ncbi:MAG: hypothetical protein QM770_15895 [Tepidisphaeraceae bacterium]
MPGRASVVRAALLTHYSAHPRLIPALNQANYNPREGAAPAGKTWYYTPYKITQIKRAAEIALIFDGSLKSNSGGVAGQWGANVTATQLDQGRIWWSNFLTDDPSLDTNWWMTGSFPIDTSSNSGNPANWNKDNDDNWSNIRFRHGKQNEANVLYVDGHVVKHYVKNNNAADILRRNVDVNFVKSTVVY